MQPAVLSPALSLSLSLSLSPPSLCLSSSLFLIPLILSLSVHFPPLPSLYLFSLTPSFALSFRTSIFRSQCDSELFGQCTCKLAASAAPRWAPDLIKRYLEELKQRAGSLSWINNETTEPTYPHQSMLALLALSLLVTAAVHTFFNPSYQQLASRDWK